MNAEQLHRITQDFLDHAKDIESSSLSIDGQAREMCRQNACGYFGKSWTCPPAIGPLEQLRLRLAAYDRFMKKRHGRVHGAL